MIQFDLVFRWVPPQKKKKYIYIYISIYPLKGNHSKRKIVFQPSFFRGHVSFFLGVTHVTVKCIVCSTFLPGDPATLKTKPSFRRVVVWYVMWAWCLTYPHKTDSLFRDSSPQFSSFQVRGWFVGYLRATIPSIPTERHIQVPISIDARDEANDSRTCFSPAHATRICICWVADGVFLLYLDSNMCPYWSTVLPINFAETKLSPGGDIIIWEHIDVWCQMIFSRPRVFLECSLGEFKPTISSTRRNQRI